MSKIKGKTRKEVSKEGYISFQKMGKDIDTYYAKTEEVIDIYSDDPAKIPKRLS